jgi:hypothetical protein
MPSNPSTYDQQQPSSGDFATGMVLIGWLLTAALAAWLLGGSMPASRALFPVSFLATAILLVLAGARLR